MSERTTLYRSRSDQMIGGVCAGIADYFEIDPTVVRLIAVLLLLVTNAAVLIAYVVLWIVVPEEPADAPEGGAVVAEESRHGTPGPAETGGPPSPSPPSPSQPSPPATAAARSTPLPQTTPPPVPGRPGRGPVWVGVALIFVGSVLLIQMFVPQLALWQFWPLVIIIAGLVMVFRRGR